MGGSAAEGAAGEQVGVVVAVPEQGGLVRQVQFTLDRRINAGQRCAQQALGELGDRLLAADVLAQRLGSGLIDQIPRIALGQAYDPPQLALANPPVTFEPVLAQGQRANR